MTEKRRETNKALAYSGAGFSFAAIVGLMAYGGYKLDEWLGTAPWLLVACAMAGVAVATWDLIRTVNALEDGRGGKGRG